MEVPDHLSWYVADLCEAVRLNNGEAVRVLMMRDDIDTTLRDDLGQSAKKLAVNYGHHNLITIMEVVEVAKKELKAWAPTEEEVGHELLRGVAVMAGSK